MGRRICCQRAIYHGKSDHVELQAAGSRVAARPAAAFCQMRGPVPARLGWEATDRCYECGCGSATAAGAAWWSRCCNCCWQEASPCGSVVALLAISSWRSLFARSLACARPASCCHGVVLLSWSCAAGARAPRHSVFDDNSIYTSCRFIYSCLLLQKSVYGTTDAKTHYSAAWLRRTAGGLGLARPLCLGSLPQARGLGPGFAVGLAQRK